MFQVPTLALTALRVLTLGLLGATLAVWLRAIYLLAIGRSLPPSDPPRAVPWKAGAVLAVLLTWMALNFIVPPIYLDLAGIRPAEPGGPFKIGPRDQILATVAINLLLVGLGTLVLRRMTGASRRDFGLEAAAVRPGLAWGLVAWPLLAPIVFGANLLALRIWTTARVTHPIEDWANADPSATTWLALTFSAVVAAPLAEEFLFRAVLLGWLTRAVSGIDLEPEAPDAGPDFEAAPMVGRPGLAWRLWGVNLLVSLVFAGMHVKVWPSPVPLFFLSLGLGALYQRTGSVIAPLTLHAVFNGIMTLSLFLAALSADPNTPRPGDRGRQEPRVPPPASAVSHASHRHLVDR